MVKKLTHITKTKLHKVNCKVCKSKLINEIEDRYLRWVSPYTLAEQYPGFSRDNINNHIKFFELDKKRSGDLDAVLDAIIERGMHCLSRIPVNAHEIKGSLELKAKLAGKLKTGGDTNVIVNLSVEEAQQKRFNNQKEGLERFGLCLQNIADSDN